MPSLCAVTSREPSNLDDVIRKMIRSSSFGQDAQVRGIIGDDAFSGCSRSLKIPDGRATTAAAIVDVVSDDSRLMIDPPNLRKGATGAARSFLSQRPAEGMDSPLFGCAILPREAGITVARDPLGTRPMSISSGNPCGAATVPKALRAGGLETAAPMPPSNFLDLGSGAAVPMGMKCPSIKPPREIGPAIEELISTLSDAIGALPSPRALYFSGGIDSLILAKLCEGLGETTLISAGIEGSKDLLRSQSAAKELSCPLVTVQIPRDAIPADVEFLRDISGTESPMPIAIALPILHAAREAKKRGISTAVAGQGADELFGGYYRYISDPDPRRTMRADLFSLHSRGMDLCDLASRASGVDIFLPYMDRAIVNLALSTPTRHLVSNGRRKILLREAGLKLGLSREAVMAKKSAIQYGSGVNKYVLRAIGGKAP